MIRPCFSSISPERIHPIDSTKSSSEDSDFDRRNCLSLDLFDICKRYLDQNPDLSHLPKADPASADVFLPNDLPVVFKKTGDIKSLDRFRRMNLIRQLCDDSGYNRLAIPKARTYGEFIIEEKLPLPIGGQKLQVGLYCENLMNMSKAVCEFTGLLCQTHYSDILTYSHSYNQSIPLARYDNIPLFLEGSNGKIGLVDLEEVDIRTQGLVLQDIVEIARKAIAIFPFHNQEIINTLVKFFPEFASNASELELYIQEVQNNFRSIYLDHHEFIKKQKIEFKYPIFTPLRIDEVCAILTEHQQTHAVILGLFQKATSVVNDGDFGETSISEVCSRTVSFNIEHLSGEIEPLTALTEILDDMKKKQEICLANFYRNRANQLYLRVHF